MDEPKQVVIRERLDPGAVALLEDAGLTVVEGWDWDERELVAGVRACHALVAGPDERVDAALLQQVPMLEVLGRIGIDLSGIDVDAATKAGVVVLTTPESRVVAAAEQALAMLLACAQDLTRTAADLRAGRWEGQAWTRRAVEVRGRTLGLLGQSQAPGLEDLAQALGMTVLGWASSSGAPTGQDLAPVAAGAVEQLSAADFLVVDFTSGEDDPRSLGEAEFAQMKDGVRIVSLAHVGVVDEAALTRALESGKVASAALALRGGERSTLAGREDVLLVPWLDTPTLDSRLRAERMLAEEIAAVLRGEFPSMGANVPVTRESDADELMHHRGLCRQLGRLLVQLADGPIDALDISYGGSFAYFDTTVLTLGVLEGLLAGLGGARVNYVNARRAADERGILVREEVQTGILDFPRMITVSLPKGGASVSGTSLGPDQKPRLVRVLGEDVDIEPASHMVFLRYGDRPGIGGAVGTMLGEWKVNIGHMSVGRGNLQGQAVMALTLDEPLSEDQVQAVVERCGLEYDRRVEL